MVEEDVEACQETRLEYSSQTIYRGLSTYEILSSVDVAPLLARGAIGCDQCLDARACGAREGRRYIHRFIEHVGP